MRKFGLVLLGAAVLVGAILRIPRLDCRPMHTDEAVQAVKTGTLLETGRYRYDPTEYHGPTLPFLGAMALRLSGVRRLADAHEVQLRAVPVAFGLGLILLTIGFAGILGRRGAIVAALLLACSPVFVFYSRYYIHETLLVFFTALFLLSLERYMRTPHVGRALTVGAAFGLVCATKETWVLEIAALAVASAGALLWGGPRFRRDSAMGTTGEWRRPRYLGVGILAAVCVAAVLFSSFLTNPHGILDSVAAFSHYAERSGAEWHRHPWYFYLARLFGDPFRPGPQWNEGAILLLAFIGGWSAFFGRNDWSPHRRLAVRTLALYTVVLFGIYCVVPYKTPWCVLGPWYGAICLAGLGVDVAWQHTKRPGPRVLAALVLAVVVADLAWQARSADVRFCADRRNPWVYAQTSPDLVRLATRVQEATALSPDGPKTPVFVIAPDYWPLPWYLRRLDRVGYWTTPPRIVRAPLVITAPCYAKSIERRLAPVRYEVQYYGLRPAVPLLLLIEPELWQAWLDAHGRSVGRPSGQQPVARTPAPPSVPETAPFRHSAMGTDFAVLIRGGDRAYARQAAKAAFAELDRIEQELSRFVPTSDISQINGLEVGKHLRIGDAASVCLKAAFQAWKDTDGAFDVTARAVPASALKDGSAAIGMQYLDVDFEAHEVSVKRPGLRVDLGGIGKGFALDRMAAVLRTWHIESALIEGGLSTALVLRPVSGKSPPPGWTLQLRDPFHAENSLGTVRLDHGALSGSAAVLHGPHIIEPRTGRPASGALAAWAFAESATMADALSTAFMVMTPEQVRACCKRLSVGGILLAGTRQKPVLEQFGAMPDIRLRNSAREPRQ